MYPYKLYNVDCEGLIHSFGEQLSQEILAIEAKKGVEAEIAIAQRARTWRSSAKDTINPADVPAPSYGSFEESISQVEAAAKIAITERSNLLKRILKVVVTGSSLGIRVGVAYAKARTGSSTPEDAEAVVKAGSDFNESLFDFSTSAKTAKARSGAYGAFVSNVTEAKNQSGHILAHRIFDDVAQTLGDIIDMYVDLQRSGDLRGMTPLEEARYAGLINVHAAALALIESSLTDIDSSLKDLARIAARHHVSGKKEFLAGLPNFIWEANRDSAQPIWFLDAKLSGNVVSGGSKRKLAAGESHPYWEKRKTHAFRAVVSALTRMGADGYKPAIDRIYMTLAAASKMVANEVAFQDLRDELNPAKRPDVLVTGHHWRIGSLKDFRIEIQRSCRGENAFVPKRRVHDLRKVEVNIAYRETEIMASCAEIEMLRSRDRDVIARAGQVHQVLKDMSFALVSIADSGRNTVETTWSSHQPLTFMSSLRDRLFTQADNAKSDTRIDDPWSPPGGGPKP